MYILWIEIYLYRFIPVCDERTFPFKTLFELSRYKIPEISSRKKKKKKRIIFNRFYLYRLFLEYFTRISFHWLLSKINCRRDFWNSVVRVSRKKVGHSLNFIHRSCCNALNLLRVPRNPGNWSRYRYETKNNFNGFPPFISRMGFDHTILTKVKSWFQWCIVAIYKDLHFFNFTLIFICISQYECW